MEDDIIKIENSIRYAEKMPPDFAAILLRDYMYIEEDYKLKLLSIPEYKKWLETKGSLMNGSVK